MVKNVLIVNPKELEEKVKDFARKGNAKFHVLADFDKTLTYALMGRKKEYPSVISILRDGNYLTPDYAQKAHALFDEYHPIEINPDIPEKEKKAKMKEWWVKHFELLIESGLNKRDLEKIVKSGIIKLRDGAVEFFDFLNKHKIPLVIMSSSGVGDAIAMYLKQERLLYSNVHIITNSFEFDKKGRAVEAKPPVIHCMNKEEITVKTYPVFDLIKARTNVLLLGDSLGDIGMIEGFSYDNLIKVGFLNENIDKNLPNFKRNFDAVLLNDTDMHYVNDLIRGICSG